MTMAMTIRKPETAAAIPSVADLQAMLARLVGEAATLRALCSGEVHTQTIRREEHQVVRRAGAVERVLVDVPHDDVRQVGPLERLQARRRLAEVEQEMAQAEETLEAAKAAAVVAARVQRTEAIAAGEQEIRRLLPSLLADVQAVQERFVAFHADLARLDQAVGSEYFTTQAAAPMFMPGGMAEAWCRFVSGGFPPDRR
jgi:hypothetical protein